MKSSADTDIGMYQIGDALTRAMAPPDRPLTHNGGKGWTVFHLTQNTFRRRASKLHLSPTEMDNVIAKAEQQYLKGVVLCESPIECMVLAALIHAEWPGITIPPIVHDAKKEAALPDGDVIIIPQMAFVRYRLDFGVVVSVAGKRRILAVECDGEEFHRDALKDQRRDAYLESWDIPAFHLTGAEIHKDVATPIANIAALAGRLPV